MKGKSEFCRKGNRKPFSFERETKSHDKGNKIPCRGKYNPSLMEIKFLNKGKNHPLGKEIKSLDKGNNIPWQGKLNSFTREIKCLRKGNKMPSKGK